MIKNQEYIGEVLSLGTEGEGVIKCDGITAFVPFCLPEERVSFKALKVSGGIAYGKLSAVHTPSPERVVPVCPYFERCGGCQLQHASYAAQLNFKRQLVVNALKKIAGLTPEVQPCVPSVKQYGYRNKLALPVGVGEDGGAAVGFYAPRSHRIVPIDKCALQADWSEGLIRALADFLNEGKLKGYDEQTCAGDVRHLVAREIDGRLIITVVATHRINLGGFIKKLDVLFKNYTLWLNINTSRGNAILGDTWAICHGDGFFMGEDCGVKFKAGANTFIQVNDGVRALLYGAVVSEVKNKDCAVIDLYSGGGMLTAMLAKCCKAAYGVEIIKEAVACADELKSLNCLEGKMFNECGAVEDKIFEVLKKSEGLTRVIVCDPPRKGMDKKVVEAVIKSGAEKVVLISCSPATLARDLGLLCGSLKYVEGQLIKTAEGGAYNIVSVTPYDMFPQTKHVETLVTLSLAKG